MPTPGPIHSDNVLVKRGRGSADFLAVMMRIGDEDSPYDVCLYRYTCPGRCDLYHFDFTRDRRVRYNAEHLEPLPKALATLADDFEKPQVVTLLLDAIKEPSRYMYSRQLVELMGLLAPKSLAFRKCGAAFNKLVKARNAVIAARRAERLALEGKQP